ncbi:hypothetical protein CVD28_05755 [Bacillus sp. M6-12]|uniref:hypothetical protein n=1 Tax=Bacillus sp. M6-12 TaxID=2054166 RepID=UPI000C763B3B|nr:hypothetical protein [Bacillus sp. M6-12]PLS18640.1 hypothetical protein CVD28_05755 [Bacillus sp. M6-12]
MQEIIGFLLGDLDLFYPLLLASVFIFVYAIVKRSWAAMLLSGILLLPDAIYFSGYPSVPFAIGIPLIQVFFAVIYYREIKLTKSAL